MRDTADTLQSTQKRKRSTCDMADKQFQPAESYNYHPAMPPADPENPADESEKTCSICMEEVDTKPGPSGEVLLGMSSRRAYALAPCGHLFHTKCLAQWLGIKVSHDVKGVELMNRQSTLR